MLASDSPLRITEIFCSLQGESTWVGERTVFVRLTGCPLRCVYCDTAYAFSGGSNFLIDEVLQSVAGFDAQFVCVTGGEPLAQRGCLALLSALCDQGYRVSLETSGALPIEDVDSRVKRIVDFKTPASGEQSRNLLSNIDALDAIDEVKFVISDHDDYDWAKAFCQKHQLVNRVSSILFSPVMAIEGNETALPARELADWILADKLQVRMQLQLHKLVWGDAPGH